jgi:Protein of unknown function (DUF2950)
MRTFSLTLCILAICGSAAAQTQKTFASAEAAADALIGAAQMKDVAQVAAIFGPQKNILMSGDAGRDKGEMAEFAQLAQTKHRLQPDPMNHDRMVLFVGSQDWPFPVPLVRTNGQWSFDTGQGAFEIRARRIGANELDAIEICAGYVEAQQKYVKTDHNGDGIYEYAQRIMSSPGKEDGLYWAGASELLVPQRFAEASIPVQPKPYHGYYFRVLTSQGPDAPGGAHNYLAKTSMIGGFGLVAWPAEYSVTGVQTFIVNQDGVVYEKDMGKPASGTAPPVTTFNPGKSWTPVD